MDLQPSQQHTININNFFHSPFENHFGNMRINYGGNSVLSLNKLNFSESIKKPVNSLTINKRLDFSKEEQEHFNINKNDDEESVASNVINLNKPYRSSFNLSSSNLEKQAPVLDSHLVEIKNSKKFFCKCKKSKCSKLYCECLVNNEGCVGCACENCDNPIVKNQFEFATHTSIAVDAQSPFIRKNNLPNYFPASPGVLCENIDLNRKSIANATQMGTTNLSRSKKEIVRSSFISPVQKKLDFTMRSENMKYKRLGGNSSTLNESLGVENLALKEEPFRKDSTALSNNDQMISNSVTQKLNIHNHKNDEVGCNCYKSNCRKKYCECYKLKKACTSLCRCMECENIFNTAKKVNSRMKEPSEDSYHIEQISVEIKRSQISIKIIQYPATNPNVTIVEPNRNSKLIQISKKAIQKYIPLGFALSEAGKPIIV